MGLATDKTLHRLLERQIKKSNMDLNDVSDGSKMLLNLVNNSYYDFDEERKLNKRVVQISQAELEETNKELQSKNDFLDGFNHGLAHDIKNHTSNIIGLITMLRKYQLKKNLAMTDVIIDKLGSSTNQLTSIVQGFLYLSRCEGKVDSEYKIISAAELLSSIELEIQFLLQGKNIAINYDLDVTDLFYSAHILKIILVNLISNAIKFSKKSIKSSYVNVSVTHTLTNLKIVVADNGIGMDLSNPDNRIFKLFKQHDTPISQKGHGVGLFVVKKITEKGNGTIDVESGLNIGTTFTINLPLNI